MKQFRKSLQIRLFALLLYAGALIIMIVKSVLVQSAGETALVRSFMIGLNAGLCVSMMTVITITLRKYIAALRHEEKCKALYIAETDERLLFIKSKTGGDALQLVLFGLVVATIVAEFYDQAVFFALLGVVLFTAAVKAIFKIVYTKKLT